MYYVILPLHQDMLVELDRVGWSHRFDLGLTRQMYMLLAQLLTNLSIYLQAERSGRLCDVMIISGGCGLARGT